MVEATVYVDDDDELFEEFRLGNGKDDQEVRDKVLDRKIIYFSIYQKLMTKNMLITYIMKKKFEMVKLYLACF